MNILVVAPQTPWPLNTGGKIRTYQLLRHISRDHDVDLVCFSPEETRLGVHECGRLPETNVRLFHVAHRPLGLASKIRKALFDERPVTVIGYETLRMEAAVKSLMRRRVYDLIHLDHVHTARYAGCSAGQPVVLDEHNVEYRILQRCGRVAYNPFKKFLFHAQAQKMKRHERRALEKINLCLAVSQEDADVLSALCPAAKIAVIPNGVDTGHFCPQSIGLEHTKVNHEQGMDCVFTGSMDWWPNEDAALWFIDEIWPHVHARHPQARFVIVGRGPTERLKARAKRAAGVVVTGEVEDVRPFIRRASVVVVPLRIGGGTRIKILEAAAMEKPVVSTSVGAEGLKFENGVDILLADGAQNFAEAVSQILSYPDTGRLIGRTAREKAVSLYDWSAIARRLEQCYERLLA